MAQKRQSGEKTLQQIQTEALFDAVIHDDPVDIVRLIENGADVNACDPQGRSLLHIAIRYDSKYAFSALLNYGANVEARNDADETPLHLAAHFTNLNGLFYVTALLAAGADVSPLDKEGCTPLQQSQYLPYATWDDLRTLQTLLEEVAENPALRPSVEEYNQKYPEHKIDAALLMQRIAIQSPSPAPHDINEIQYGGRAQDDSQHRNSIGG